MLLEVLEAYRSPYPDPIELKTGDTVTLGEESRPDGPYPGWVFCVSGRTGRKGWVAKDVLSMENGKGRAERDYTSKEMDVAAGDTVDTLYELNGWYWCVRQGDGETGWVAKDVLRLGGMI